MLRDRSPSDVIRIGRRLAGQCAAITSGAAICGIDAGGAVEHRHERQRAVHQCRSEADNEGEFVDMDEQRLPRRVVQPRGAVERLLVIGGARRRTGAPSDNPVGVFLSGRLVRAEPGKQTEPARPWVRNSDRCGRPRI